MNERGAATVAMLGVLLAVVAMLLAAVAASGAVDAHSRARAAADLGVLAGAGQARDLRALGKPFTEAACERASQIVGRHDAHVVSCAVTGRAVVTLTVRTNDAWHATARSRAGPAGAEGR